MAALAFAAASLACAEARAERITVRGHSAFDARVRRDRGDLVVEGVLRDDVGEALGKQIVALTLARRDANGGADPATDEALRAAHSCGVGLITGRTRGLEIATDGSGRFCVRARLEKERFIATLAWKGAPLLEGTTLSVPVDLGRRAVSLAFEPRPRTVSLERTPARFFASAETDDEGVAQPLAGLPLTLAIEGSSGGAPIPLGTATTDARGRAAIDVETQRLGPPRGTHLVLAFAGDADAVSAEARTPIEIHSRVTLRSPTLEGPSSPSNPEEGIPIEVLATTAAGPVSEGVVEATVGDVVVGAARVEGGRANLVVTFSAEGGGTREVRVRYLPQSPWHLAGPEVRGELALRGPSSWSRAPLAIAGLLLVGWLVAGRRRAVPSPARGGEGAGAARVPTERASLEVVPHAAGTARRGEYTGTVEDAHEGVPLARVRVRVERRTFAGVETLADAVTDDAGRFSFVLEAKLPGDSLAAEGPFHARFDEALPQPGALRIALITRKRRLVERLVGWARRVGGPYDARPEPTPGHVRRAARGRDAGVAAWAAAVERAAYDHQSVDERAEADVLELAPRPDLLARDGAGPRAAADPRPDLAKVPKRV
ncbi:MAG: hypothetical protein IPF92_10270 [Myxococcales bacterium]|nr:hypothetical protein [Myxococcales bacterium]MBL0192869.1 hypothetical protein [Myxococcales bacterium]HQY60298.1 hypothetical protein [Polyangiaceae bacterium]